MKQVEKDKQNNRKNDIFITKIEEILVQPGPKKIKQGYYLIWTRKVRSYINNINKLRGDKT